MCVVSIQIIISSLQTHNVYRCGRSRHLTSTLSLHDALPIYIQALLLRFAIQRCGAVDQGIRGVNEGMVFVIGKAKTLADRKSTRLNSSHRCISYAVFCLKKKIMSIDVVEVFIWRERLVSGGS